MSIASGISLLIPYCHRNLLLGARQDTIAQFGYLTPLIVQPYTCRQLHHSLPFLSLY